MLCTSKAHVATAGSWRGPYTIVKDRPLVWWDDAVDRLVVFEDVHMWFDKPTERWMMLMYAVHICSCLLPCSNMYVCVTHTQLYHCATALKPAYVVDVASTH